jgi:hypothetical protein
MANVRNYDVIVSVGDPRAASMVDGKQIRGDDVSRLNYIVSHNSNAAILPEGSHLTVLIPPDQTMNNNGLPGTWTASGSMFLICSTILTPFLSDENWPKIIFLIGMIRLQNPMTLCMISQHGL